jgi:periplasmic mercuric ion binding protein
MKISKSILVIVLAGTFLVSCKKEATATVETVKIPEVKTIAADAKLATTDFNIEGMTCAEGCAKTIEKKLTETEGVKSATVDFEKKSAKVEYDSNSQTPEKLVQIVEKTGDGKTYKVSNVKNSQDKAMLFQQENPKKSKSKKATKDVACSESKPASTTTEAKPSCCSSKKHCDKDEKKETM